MKFNNENFEKIYKQLLDNPNYVDILLTHHPKSKVASAALIVLSGGDFNPDDWECDMANIVFPEARTVNREAKRAIAQLRKDGKPCKI